MSKRVLVLGVDGMVGHTVFEYLSQNTNIHTIGTSRKRVDGKRILTFDLNEFERDFENIPRVDFIINCIGALKNNSFINLKIVNEVFPKKLVNKLSHTHSKIIHISTDAVFDTLSGAVDEYVKPNPNDEYGFSKLRGEIVSHPNITIRTSFLGIGNNGLLHWLLNTNNSAIEGYVNQTWSGCTSLQFAQFCEDIIMKNKIVKPIEKISLIHFAPLGPVSKYDILKSAINVFKIKKTITPVEGLEITRYLTSSIIDFKHNPRYTNSVQDALMELKDFEMK